MNREVLTSYEIMYDNKNAHESKKSVELNLMVVRMNVLQNIILHFLLSIVRASVSSQYVEIQKLMKL